MTICYLFQPLLAATHTKAASAEETGLISPQILTWFAIFLAAGCLGLFLFVVYLKARHRRDRINEVYAAETRIAKKVHDEVSNELYNVMLFAASEDLSSPKMKNMLLASLQNLYSVSREIASENGTIDTGAGFSENLTFLLNTFNTARTNIIARGINIVDWEEIDDAKKLNTYRVLQELMVNMARHSMATVAVVEFAVERNMININYSDNGIGMPGGRLQCRNGLHNVENRMVSIGGNVIFESNAGNGLRLTLTYPARTPYVQKDFNNRRYRQR